MQTVMADAAWTRADLSTGDRRPVRLLVPAKRKSDFWLPEADTLRAADLGITRTITDDQLDDVLDDARKLLRQQGIAENPQAYLIRIRDALRIPRDLDEALTWGMFVPTEWENQENVHPKTSHHLGWWWVYDTSRTETRDERRARMLSDNRIVDKRGYAAAICRSYAYTSELKFAADRTRRILAGGAGLEAEARKVIEEEGVGELEETKRRLTAKARKDILRAMPEPDDQLGQSPVWVLHKAFRSGRDRQQLDDWYQYSKPDLTGRPPGSRTRRRAKTRNDR